MLNLCIHLELILFYHFINFEIKFKKFTSEKTLKKQCLSILVLCNHILVKRFNDILRPDDGQIWSETCRLSE
jgi:hypothetical protein